MDCFICGLGPLENEQLVVLGYPKERDAETNAALRPILCVIQYKNNDYEEICTNSLSLRGSVVISFIVIVLLSFYLYSISTDFSSLRKTKTKYLQVFRVQSQRLSFGHTDRRESIFYCFAERYCRR